MNIGRGCCGVLGCGPATASVLLSTVASTTWSCASWIGVPVTLSSTARPAHKAGTHAAPKRGYPPYSTSIARRWPEEMTKSPTPHDSFVKSRWRG